MEVELNVSPDNYTCSICLEENIEEEVISKTNCTHSFCNKCLEDWLNKGKYSCPLCRNEIKTYVTNNKETRILPIFIRTNNIPMVNNIPITIALQNLVNYNVKLKYSLYISLSTILILGNYYIHNKYNYYKLVEQYNECFTNLNTYIDNYRETVPVEVYETNDSLRICSIPLYFYNKCFH